MKKPTTEYLITVDYAYSKTRYVMKDRAKAQDCYDRHMAKPTVYQCDIKTREVGAWLPLTG